MTRSILEKIDRPGLSCVLACLFIKRPGLRFWKKSLLLLPNYIIDQYVTYYISFFFQILEA